MGETFENYQFKVFQSIPLFVKITVANDWVWKNETMPANMRVIGPDGGNPIQIYGLFSLDSNLSGKAYLIRIYGEGFLKETAEHLKDRLERYAKHSSKKDLMGVLIDAEKVKNGPFWPNSSV